MQIVGYSDHYKTGVLSCLKRNYQWMSEKSDAELYQWLKPILNYSWEEDFPISQFPYKFGMVLLDDENEVVGYLGLIYSKQFVDDSWKTVVNPTTWAIDEEYRSETFKCIYYVQQTADIVVDYTARQSLVEIFTKFFHYENIDQIGCFFLPRPYLEKHRIKVRRVTATEQICSEEIKKVFTDHRIYDIRCMEVIAQNTKHYVFYKIEKRATVLKNLIPMDAIYVLYTDDPIFFGEYAKEIIWKMQAIEHAALKTDSRFFNIRPHEWKKLRTFPINRLVFGDCESKEKLGSIYTELAILLDY